MLQDFFQILEEPLTAQEVPWSKSKTSSRIKERPVTFDVTWVSVSCLNENLLIWFNLIRNEYSQTDPFILIFVPSIGALKCSVLQQGIISSCCIKQGKLIGSCGVPQRWVLGSCSVPQKWDPGTFYGTHKHSVLVHYMDEYYSTWFLLISTGMSTQFLWHTAGISTWCPRFQFTFVFWANSES